MDLSPQSEIQQAPDYCSRSHAKLSTIVSAGVVSIWIVAWLWSSRTYQLDDAFITLRYARHLVETGHFWFNRNQSTYGFSSPLFLALVALAYPFLKIFAAKIISDSCYIVLIALLFTKATFESRKDLRTFLIVSVLIAVAPLSIRWLTDGMETSAATIAGITLAMAAVTESATEEQTLLRYFLLVLMGAIITALRIEFSFVIMFVTLAICLFRLGPMRNEGSFAIGRYFAAIVKESHLALGSLITLLWVEYLFGRILPDTATAKALASHAFTLWDVGDFIREFVASGALGIGLIVLWLATVYSVFAPRAGRRIGNLIVNLVFPVLAALAIMRGQIIQVRYFVPILAFIITWNFAWLDALHVEVEPVEFILSARFAIPALALILIVDFSLEGVGFSRLQNRVSAMFAQMRSDHLEVLASQVGMATDIGYVSYFTDAQICDVAGLVNGSSFASLSAEQRLRICASSKPTFSYFDAAQEEIVDRVVDLNSMPICNTYRYATLRGTDAYFLRVSPSLSGVVCGDATKP
jgi:hypothetical protein